MPLPLPLTCTVGECASPKFMGSARAKDAGGAAAPSEAPAVWLPLLASLPLALVVVAGALCTAYVVLNR